jgi:hypothetical protein
LADPVVLDLVWQYLTCVVSDGGNYMVLEDGNVLGCRLTMLMGVLYPLPLDRHMAQMGCCYLRYMDDWMVLTPDTLEAAPDDSGGQLGDEGAARAPAPGRNHNRHHRARF